MKKTRLRTADGKRQTRSVDDMLKEAVSDETLANLPGKGEPLNLKSYFSSGEEFRAAGQILKENNLLPPHLQERKDAEELIQTAENLFSEAKEQIPQLRAEVIKDLESIVSIFPDRITCQTFLSLDDWPQDYPKPTGAHQPLKSLVEMIPHITQQINRYNARINNTIYRYLSCLKKAQKNIENYHKRQLLNITLSPTYNYLPPINLEHKEQDIRAAFTPLPELPTDLPKRLKSWHQKISPPIWQRIFQP